MPRVRLDKLVVDRGLAPSREKAQVLILAGQIQVNGAAATRAGALVPSDARVELAGELPRYVGRGGEKLEGALEGFSLNVAGKVCLDIGASTGGFTDCLLQHGAARVYAVDVGKGQLDWKLRRDPRVVVREGLNARYLQLSQIGEAAELITIDVSFISLEKILPAAVACGCPGATLVALVKPQFELGRGRVGKGGVVRDPALQQEAVGRVWRAATALGLETIGVQPSRLLGAEGNQEFFLRAVLPSRPRIK
jgi:23S rRNA (cytidine1920-2'-O)/16S rRNA (cytidine1409-2'-O)-methyltransferase